MRTVDQQSQGYSSPRAPSLAADLAELGGVLRSLVDPYRPELYYMRGPGPKWHAKHDPPPAIVDASAVPLWRPRRWRTLAPGVAARDENGHSTHSASI